eukprot:258579-Amphidinium_carterae.1
MAIMGEFYESLYGSRGIANGSHQDAPDVAMQLQGGKEITLRKLLEEKALPTVLRSTQAMYKPIFLQRVQTEWHLKQRSNHCQCTEVWVDNDTVIFGTDYITVATILPIGPRPTIKNNKQLRGPILGQRSERRSIFEKVTTV